MHPTARLLWIVPVAAAALLTNCQRPTSPPLNHDPTITLLTALPADIAPTDSVVITCIASDPDGDTLVYDWETDLRLNIRGVPAHYPVKTNTYNNSETFYPAYTPTGLETLWVVTTARDRRGGGAIKLVTFTIHP